MPEDLENENDDCGCSGYPVQPCKCVDGKRTFPKIPSNG